MHVRLKADVTPPWHSNRTSQVPTRKSYVPVCACLIPTHLLCSPWPGRSMWIYPPDRVFYVT